jgi:hypothetical protein
MAIYLSNRDGGKTDEQGHYKFQTNAFTGNVLDGGLLVTQNSPLAMNVEVSGGDARIPYSDYAYTAWIPAGSPETVTVTTANPSNPRIDRLVMYVDRGETPSSATANNPTLCKLMLVAGTPAGSPSRPSNGTVDTAVSNNPYIDLADIRVNAGVTQITDANITDTRVLVGAPIADGSVTNTKISPTGISLGYVNQTTSVGTTNTTSATLIGALTKTVTIPAGGRDVEVSVHIPSISNASSSTRATTIEIQANGTGIGGGVNRGVGTNTSFPATHTPSAGSITYRAVYIKETGADGTTLGATSTNPMQLSIKLV